MGVTLNHIHYIFQLQVFTIKASNFSSSTFIQAKIYPLYGKVCYIWGG